MPSPHRTPRREEPSPRRSNRSPRQGLPTPTAGSRTPRSQANRTPSRAETPSQNGRTSRQGTRSQNIAQLAGTPTRSQGSGTPTRSQSSQGNRTPRAGNRTPSRQSPRQGNRTPSRQSPRHGNRTPSRGNTTPRSEIDTPMRWPSGRGGEGEVPASPAQSMPSPGGGLALSEIDLSSPLNYGTPSSMASVRTPRSGIRGTPIRLRPDVRTDRRMRQVNVGGEQLEAVPEEADNRPNLVIWGTDVSVADCKEKFKQFLLRFIDPDAEEDERTDDMNVNEPLYMQKLEEINSLEIPFLNVNCSHLETFDRNLYRQLICYPQEVIPTFDMIVNELFYEKYPAAVLEHQIQVRPYNADKTRNMRALNPEDIDQLITISGMVIRATNIMPEMREAFFKCIVCSFSTTVEIDRGRITEPTLCTSCNTNHCFAIVHNRCQFTNKQLVKLQESPDDMPAGQTPHTISLYAHNDLVDTVQPGDRVTVTGIYRAQHVQVNPRARNVRSVYKTHIDVLHYRKVDTKRLYEEEEGKDHRFPPERIELLQMLSKKNDIYDRLSRSIAPSIYENDDIKKGILLQLFGGTKKLFNASGRTNFRSEINILLCGDPGTSKSQFLQYVYNLVPRSQYTSGKGSSAVGLTAYVTKDSETKQLVLQTGALVLADNGICCIDEFDKMNDSTRSVLHEVMEQQTLSIAKAGIICQLNARTSILAAANPSESQWNQKKTIIENVQLPPTLLSRFDLIFLVLDPQSELFDRRLALHLVGIYYKVRRANEDNGILDMSIVRDYIAYAKEHIHPKLNESASQKLIQAYVDMRKVGSNNGQITAYPRQLESLIRLAEAHAKVRFSQVVEDKDVDEAWRLHREALKQSATDPLSGRIDVGILTTGLTEAARKKRAELVKVVRKLIVAKGRVPTVNYKKFYDELKEDAQTLITLDQYEEALKELQTEGLITVTGRTTIRICKA